ncbi:hypothetical protein GALMADRAFT_232623 [Galerina marginata CBS 339.88]|uniref:Hydrophobic surface binding protein n=1 Tax=Galerina marginata (strain CBS 339.88) TaxID=685588 RepID=A0A067S8H7_GALM3|nr:hypothetical protein GALMADRAFT_232623 [Galerina marginata CBS 339.88]
MKLQTTFIFLSSLVAATLASTVTTDFATINTRTTALDNSIKAFSITAGTLAQALAIHNDAVAVNSAVTKTTSDLQVALKPIADSDTDTILEDLAILDPIVQSALTGIVAKKPAFDALPIGNGSGTAKQDLKDLSNSATTLLTTLAGAVSTGKVAQVNAYKTKFQTGLQVATNAYN